MRYFKIGYNIAFFLIFISIKSSFADVGIIVALNTNLEQLKEKLKIEDISQKAKREFYSGKIDNIDVVLVRSPMGKVNNAITAQSLLSHYPIKSIISIAPAGAVDNTLNIGDVVVATELYQHDFGTIKPYGFIWNRVPDGTNRDEPGYNIANKGLRELAILYVKDKKKTQNKITQGVIISGDQFISSPKKIDWLFKKFGAMAVDMGAAAIAQVCYANRVPFCILRTITDKGNIKARIDFEKSIPSYQSDIEIIELLGTILHGIQSK